MCQFFESITSLFTCAGPLFGVFFCASMKVSVFFALTSEASRGQINRNRPTNYIVFVFLAIFRNEITTILTPSSSEGVSGGCGVVMFFILEVPDYESAMLIYFYIYIYTVMDKSKWTAKKK